MQRNSEASNRFHDIVHKNIKKMITPQKMMAAMIIIAVTATLVACPMIFVIRYIKNTIAMIKNIIQG